MRLFTSLNNLNVWWSDEPRESPAAELLHEIFEKEMILLTKTITAEFLWKKNICFQ